MSRLLHYRKQTFEDTGYTESLCGWVLRQCDTTKNKGDVECRNCIRELDREPMEFDVNEKDYKFKPKKWEF